MNATRFHRNVLMALPLVLLATGGKVASGQCYEEVYSDDFSSDPAWVTNNSKNYYWEAGDETYFSRQIDGADEYAYKLLPLLQPGYKWRLEYEIRPLGHTYASLFATKGR